MAGNGLKWLKMARNGWDWQEWLEMAENGWALLKMAGKAGMAVNGCKWL